MKLKRSEETACKQLVNSTGKQQEDNHGYIRIQIHCSVDALSETYPEQLIICNGPAGSYRKGGLRKHKQPKSTFTEPYMYTGNIYC